MQLITLMLRLPWITFLSKCCSTFLRTNSFRWVFLDGQFRLYLFEKAPFLGQGELHSEDTLREQRFSFPHFHIFMKCHIQTFHLSWGPFNCVEWIAYINSGPAMRLIGADVRICLWWRRRSQVLQARREIHMAGCNNHSQSSEIWSRFPYIYFVLSSFVWHISSRVCL